MHFVSRRLYLLNQSKVETEFSQHFGQKWGVWKKWHPPKSHQNRSTGRKKGQIDSNLATLGPYDSDAFFWYADRRKWRSQNPCGVKKSPKSQKCRFFIFFEKNVIFPRKNGKENRYFWPTTGKFDFSKFWKFFTVLTTFTRKKIFQKFLGKNPQKNVQKS